MSQIYVVANRYGTELGVTCVFYTEEEAKSFIHSAIAQDIIDDYPDELSDDDISLEDNEAILAWGIDRCYCDEYTYMGDNDWHEFNLTKVELDMDRLEEQEEEKDL